MLYLWLIYCGCRVLVVPPPMTSTISLFWWLPLDARSCLLTDIGRPATNWCSSNWSRTLLSISGIACSSCFLRSWLNTDRASPGYRRRVWNLSSTVNPIGMRVSMKRFLTTSYRLFFRPRPDQAILPSFAFEWGW